MKDIATPDFKDPSTNNGDWRHDAEFRMGWNACRDVVIDSIEKLKCQNDVLSEEVELLKEYSCQLKRKLNHSKQECDRLKAILQDVNTSDYRFSVDQLSQHDAAVIERFCDYAKTKYRFGLHTLAEEFNQVSQQTIHGRD